MSKEIDPKELVKTILEKEAPKGRASLTTQLHRLKKGKLGLQAMKNIIIEFRPDLQAEIKKELIVRKLEMTE